MKMRIIIFSLVILYLSTGVVLAEAVGKLTLEKGILKVRTNGVDTVYREQGSGIEVHNGSEIQMAGSSFAKLQLYQNNDEIEIFSNTLFIVSSISQETSEVSIPVGKSRFLIKPRKMVRRDRKRFRLKTTNALIGVKGTDFVVGVYDGNTSLLTLEGVVLLSNISEPEVEVEVKLNQASSIKQDTRPTAPVVVSPKAREAILATDTPAAFKSVIFGETVAPAKTDTKKKEKKEEDKKKKGRSAPEKSQKEKTATLGPASGEEETKVASDEVEEDEAGEEELEVPDTELDDILDEINEIIEEVVEETETSASEVEVILEILE